MVFDKSFQKPIKSFHTSESKHFVSCRLKTLSFVLHVNTLAYIVLFLENTQHFRSKQLCEDEELHVQRTHRDMITQYKLTYDCTERSYKTRPW